jgi:hypothetical protein
MALPSSSKAYRKNQSDEALRATYPNYVREQWIHEQGQIAQLDSGIQGKGKQKASDDNGTEDASGDKGKGKASEETGAEGPSSAALPVEHPPLQEDDADWMFNQNINADAYSNEQDAQSSRNNNTLRSGSGHSVGSNSQIRTDLPYTSIQKWQDWWQDKTSLRV